MTDLSSHPGYRILDAPPPPPAALIEALRSVPVPIIGDCTGRGTGTRHLRPYHADLRETLCGPALTVRVRPGDNLMIHKALLMARAGDVIVIDGGADTSQALIGGLIRTTAVAKRLAGWVVDGAIRDILEWAEPGMPVFARSHTHRGPSKDGPGMINVPVSVDGLVIHPGDIVIGDADGVIALNPHEAGGLLGRFARQLEHEARLREQNAVGEPDAERIDAMLRAKGLPI